MARLSGQHWGMQKTSLLGRQRFDERLPGMDGILWTKLTHAAGRRYYVHAALRIYHSEGTDNVSNARRSRHERIAIDRAIGDDSAYLDILRATNPDKYRRTVRRVWRPKVMSAIVRGPVSSSPRRDASA